MSDSSRLRTAFVAPADPRSPCWGFCDIPGFPGWIAALRFDRRPDGVHLGEVRLAPECDGIVVEWTSPNTGAVRSVSSRSKGFTGRQRPRQPEVTTRMLREVPLGRMRSEVIGQFSDAAPGMLDGGAEPVKRRRASASGRELDLAKQMERYVKLVADPKVRNPTTTLARECGLSPGTISNRRKEAERMGLITRTRPRMAGGELTAKARRLLGEGN